MTRVRIDGLESLQTVHETLFDEGWINFPSDWFFVQLTLTADVADEDRRIYLDAVELVNVRSTKWRSLLRIAPFVAVASQMTPVVESILIENCTFGAENVKFVTRPLTLMQSSSVTIKASSMPDWVVADEDDVPVWSDCTIIDSLVGHRRIARYIYVSLSLALTTRIQQKKPSTFLRIATFWVGVGNFCLVF